MVNHFIKSAVIVIIALLFIGCSGAPNVFEGQWVENKNPQNVWQIVKNGDKFVGTRISGSDSYATDTEEWILSKEGKFQDPSKHILVLNSTLAKDGTKVTYMPSKDMILRLPPGVSYKRKKIEQ